MNKEALDRALEQIRRNLEPLVALPDPRDNEAFERWELRQEMELTALEEALYLNYIQAID